MEVISHWELTWSFRPTKPVKQELKVSNNKEVNKKRSPNEIIQQQDLVSVTSSLRSSIDLMHVLGRLDTIK